MGLTLEARPQWKRQPELEVCGIIYMYSVSLFLLSLLEASLGCRITKSAADGNPQL
jgi:hypothetical protein